MRGSLALFFLAMLCAAIASAQTVNVRYDFVNYVTQPAAVKLITLTPLQPAGDYNGTTNLVPSPISRVTDTSGIYTFSNVVVAYSYSIDLFDGTRHYTKTNFFPSALTNTSAGYVNGAQYTGFFRGQIFAFFTATNFTFNTNYITTYQTNVAYVTNLFYVTNVVNGTAVAGSNTTVTTVGTVTTISANVSTASVIAAQTNAQNYALTNGAAQIASYSNTVTTLFTTKAQTQASNAVTLAAANLFSGTNKLNYSNITNAPTVPSTNNLVSYPYLTNFTLLYSYPTSNPSLYVSRSITNGFATQSYVQGLIAAGTNAASTNLIALIYSVAQSGSNNVMVASNNLQVLAFQQSTNAARAATNGLPSGIFSLGSASQSNASAFITPAQLGATNANYTTIASVNSTSNILKSFSVTIGAAATNNDIVVSNGAVASAAALASAATNGLPSRIWNLGSISLRGSNDFYLNSNSSNYFSGQQVSNLASQYTLTSIFTASTNRLATNATFFSLSIGANATNNDVNVSNNVLTIAQSYTNGLVNASSGQATSLSIFMNLNLGSWTNFQQTTNIIGVKGSGVPQADGTYELYSAGLWTNLNSPKITILASGGNFYIQTNGTSLYANPTLEGSWTVVAPNGVAPAPYSSIGQYFYLNNLKFVGFLNSTNLTYQITNAVATLGITSNQVVAIVTAYASNPTNGISAATTTNIILSFNYASLQAMTNALIVLSNNLSSISGVTASTVTNIVNALTPSIANNTSLGGVLFGTPTNASFNAAGTNAIHFIATNAFAAAAFGNGTANSTSQSNMTLVTPTITSPTVSGFTAASGVDMNNNSIFKINNLYISSSSPNGTIIAATNGFNVISNAPSFGIILWGGQSNNMGDSSSHSMIFNGWSNYMNASYSQSGGQNVVVTNDRVWAWSDGHPIASTTNSQIVLYATNGMILNGSPIVNAGSVTGIVNSVAGNSIAYGVIKANGQTNWGIDLSVANEYEIFITSYGTNYVTTPTLNIFFTNFDYLLSSGSNSARHFVIRLRNLMSNSVSYRIPTSLASGVITPHIQFNNWYSDGGSFQTPTNLPIGYEQKIEFDAFVRTQNTNAIGSGAHSFIEIEPSYQSRRDPASWAVLNGGAWGAVTGYTGYFGGDNSTIATNINRSFLTSTNFGGFAVLAIFDQAKVYIGSDIWDSYIRFVGSDAIVSNNFVYFSQYETLVSQSNNNNMVWSSTYPHGFLPVVAAATNIFLVYDTDATSFLSRAGMTNSLSYSTASNAIIALVSNLKSSNLWSSFYALHPYAAATTNGDSINLIGTNYTIVWNGFLTNALAHGSFGISNTDSVTLTNNYGDTRFIPTNAALNSFSIGAWSVAGTTNVGTFFIGSRGAATSYGELVLFGNLSIGGFNGSISGSPSSGGFVNTNGVASNLNDLFIAVSRTVSGTTNVTLAVNNNFTVQTVAGASTNSPVSVYVAGIHNTVGGLSAYAVAGNGISLGLTFIAQGFTTNDLSALQSIISTYETSMGR